MILDIDRFEDFDDTVTEVRSRGKRKTRLTDRKINENFREEPPEKKIETHIKKIESNWKNLTKKEQEQNLTNYYKWVEISLKEKQPLFQESDLRVNINNKITTITHKPTGYYAVSVGLESDHLRQRDAETNLYNRIDRHFRDWTKTLDEFKQSHIVPVLDTQLS